MPKSVVKAKVKLSPSVQKKMQAWANKINASWRKSVEAVIATGQLLIDAKDDVGHGNFLELLKNEEYLAFDEDKAQSLMTVARHPWISNTENFRYLPPSYTTLETLAALPAAAFPKLVKKSEVHANMTGKDAADVVKKVIPPEEDEDEAPAKPTKGSKFSRDAEDAEEVEEVEDDGEVIDHDPDEKPAAKTGKKGKLAKPTVTKGSGGMSPVQSAISNYGNGVDSLLEFIETLDEHLPDDEDPTLPAQIMAETKKLIANLNRIVKEYK